MSFVVYRVESRRLKTVTAIPWAEPAPVVAVPYPSYLGKVAIRRDPLKREIQSVELNVFPPTPVDSSTFLPAWFDQKGNRSKFDRIRLDTPELDRYPATPVDSSAFLPAWMLKAANQTNFDRQKQDLPELNVYPVTDPGLLSGFYPGSALAEANKVWFRRKHQETPEFDLWPATPPVPEQPLTSFLLKEAFIKPPQVRELQITPQIFVDAAQPPTPDCHEAFIGSITDTEGYIGTIDDSTTAVIGLINDDPVASIGTIFPNKAFIGIIDPSDTGFQGEITDSEGFEGEICEC